MASAHDTSRVLQTLLKYGTAEQRDEIFEEMKPSFATLMSQKYSSFYLLKVLEFGSPTHRQFILKCIIGNTRKLLKNSSSAKVVEEMYTKYTKPAEKRKLLNDLCGAAFRRVNDGGDRTFREVFNDENVSSENKDRMISTLKTSLCSMATQGKGRIAQLSVVHAVLDEFLSCCPYDNPIRKEVLDTWRDNIEGLLNTKVGCRCAQHFIWESDAKERKLLLKSLKPIMGRLLQDVDACNFILSIIDTVDDVVLTSKLVIKPLLTRSQNDEFDEALGCDAIEESFMDPVTRRYILYLISPRDSNHFSPTFVASLKSPVLPNGEPLHVKKTFEERLGDLRRVSSIDEALLNFLIKQMPLFPNYMDNDLLLALVTVLNHVKEIDGKREKVFAIFAHIIDLDCDEKKCMSVESPAMNIALKRLMSNEENKAVLVEKLAGRLEKEKQIVSRLIVSNRGCFFLLHLMESGVKGVEGKCREMIKPFLNIIHKLKSSGAKLLASKMT